MSGHGGATHLVVHVMIDRLIELAADSVVTCGQAFAARGEGGMRNESVDKLLADHLLHDALVVVVAESAGQFVVIHLRLILANAPQTSNRFRIEKLIRNIELIDCLKLCV